MLSDMLIFSMASSARKCRFLSASSARILLYNNGEVRFNVVQKVHLSILVMPFGNAMLLSLLQPVNARAPRYVTPLGMEMLSNSLQPTKARAPIWFTVSGMLTFLTLASSKHAIASRE
jgi:hypothetical protein